MMGKIWLYAWPNDILYTNQIYHKRQKLSERKVLRFIGFHSNVGKTFADFTSSVLKESHHSKDSPGKLSRFVESLQKL